MSEGKTRGLSVNPSMEPTTVTLPLWAHPYLGHPMFKIDHKRLITIFLFLRVKQLRDRLLLNFFLLGLGPIAR